MGQQGLASSSCPGFHCSQCWADFSPRPPDSRDCACPVLFCYTVSFTFDIKRKARKKREKEMEEGREEWRGGKERNLGWFSARSNTSYVLGMFSFNSSFKRPTFEI